MGSTHARYVKYRRVMIVEIIIIFKRAKTDDDLSITLTDERGAVDTRVVGEKVAMAGAL